MVFPANAASDKYTFNNFMGKSSLDSVLQLKAECRFRQACHTAEGRPIHPSAYFAGTLWRRIFWKLLGSFPFLHHS